MTNLSLAPLALSETIDATPAELINAVKAIGFDDVVAKRKRSFYEPGRQSGTWVKQRINKGQEFRHRRLQAGCRSLDALIVGYYRDDGNLYYAIPLIRLL